MGITRYLPGYTSKTREKNPGKDARVRARSSQEKSPSRASHRPYPAKTGAMNPRPGSGFIPFLRLYSCLSEGKGLPSPAPAPRELSTQFSRLVIMIMIIMIMMSNKIGHQPRILIGEL